MRKLNPKRVFCIIWFKYIYVLFLNHADLGQGRHTVVLFHRIIVNDGVFIGLSHEKARLDVQKTGFSMIWFYIFKYNYEYFRRHYAVLDSPNIVFPIVKTNKTKQKKQKNIYLTIAKKYNFGMTCP